MSDVAIIMTSRSMYTKVRTRDEHGIGVRLKVTRNVRIRPTGKWSELHCDRTDKKELFM